VNESEDDQDPSVEEIASRLKGKTLKVYWFLLRHPQPTTLREIQRETGLSSPSLASYHLDKLKELELVGEDNHGQFILKRNVKVGILRFFAGSTLLMVCFIFNLFRFGPISVLLFLVLCFGLLTSWVETIRTWKIKI
jgi:DNA-binding transcriptional ArsR family regulator